MGAQVTAAAWPREHKVKEAEMGLEVPPGIF